ncbi:hypothetical protein IFM89_034430 [Coptis chinensis]|uniref:Saccharopine dehydrogenase NADP binding domain-containing protein n=1 Tax=Coptis chinensis TaxID=261450 RepID=A0A835IZZ6_9MAGN|nr:hypothetical protein IFM89_034430 [Coptis chinensis]
MEYDLVIFGASGFTGKYVVREALKFLNTPSSPLKTLVLAGRNPSKLAQTLTWASSQSTTPSSISIIKADISDPSSLLNLFSKSKLVLNCVGPFRLYGEPVVSACVETGCDYLDICGEPEFMEKMEVRYHDKAVEKGSLVVSACGFDSIPAELGLMFHCKQWVPPSVPYKVEAYLSLESEKSIVGNFGTYESAVLGVANMEKLMELRKSRPNRARPLNKDAIWIPSMDYVDQLVKYGYGKKMAPVNMTTIVSMNIFQSELRMKASDEAAADCMVSPRVSHIPGPRPSKGATFEHQKKIGLWGLKLPSADSTVVRRTFVTLTENPDGLPGVNESEEEIEKRKSFWASMKPAHFGVKIASKSPFGLIRVIIAGIFIGLFGQFSFGRWLLLKFPSLFTAGWFKKKGPTEEEVESAFFKMWFVGQGYSDVTLASEGNRKPDMEVITRVTGPEIGYVTTPIVLVQCALVLLGRRNSLPKGGVYPPGIVFGATDLQERLQENGISFDLISKNTYSA